MVKQTADEEQAAYEWAEFVGPKRVDGCAFDYIFQLFLTKIHPYLFLTPLQSFFNVDWENLYY